METMMTTPQNHADSTDVASGPRAGGVLRVIRDAVLIFLTSFVVGALIGFVAAATGSEWLLSGTRVTDVLCVLVGLWLSATRGPRPHWMYLLYVATGVWLLSSVNLLLGSTVSSWLGTAAITAGCAAVAGIVVQLTRRRS